MRIFPLIAMLVFSLPVLSQEVPLPRPRPDPVAGSQSTGIVVPPVPDRADDGLTPAIVAPETPAEPKAPEEPRIYQTACPALMVGLIEARPLPPIEEGAQCGAQSPLELTGLLVNGRMVPLTSPATTDCGMATALQAWVSDVDGYLYGREKTRVSALIAGSSYVCRNVANDGTEPSRTSEHAFANALDVVGFKLDDGRSITVLKGWTGSLADGSAIMRFARDAACAHFMTVLGPEANEDHHDHLHVDLGCHGKSCQARLCE